MPTRLLLVLFAVSVPPPAGSADESAPDERLRRGNEAFKRGELDAAGEAYARAAERTTDPGLAAFNLGVVELSRGNAREAELCFARTLDDEAAPADRLAKAYYNCGVALLSRGGGAAVARAAIACFELALAGGLLDAPTAADAQHNHELAKLIWNEARKAERKPPMPNEPLPPVEPPPLEVKAPEPTPAGDPGSGRGGRPTSAGAAPKTPPATETEQSTPGAGTLPVLLDREPLAPLSPDDARALLRRVTARLVKDRAFNA